MQPHFHMVVIGVARNLTTLGQIEMETLTTLYCNILIYCAQFSGLGHTASLATSHAVQKYTETVGDPKRPPANTPSSRDSHC
jgi:hypothetical protein